MHYWSPPASVVCAVASTVSVVSTSVVTAVLNETNERVKQLFHTAECRLKNYCTAQYHKQDIATSIAFIVMSITVVAGQLIDIELECCLCRASYALRVSSLLEHFSMLL